MPKKVGVNGVGGAILAITSGVLEHSRKSSSNELRSTLLTQKNLKLPKVKENKCYKNSKNSSVLKALEII